MVSACPRPVILTISVTPLLRFCFLKDAFAIAQGTVWSASAETISIGPRSGFAESTFAAVQGLKFAEAAWKSGSPAPRENHGQQAPKRVADDHRLPIKAADDRLLIVGDLADPLTCEHLRMRSGLGDCLGIVGPARGQPHVASL